MPYIQTEEMFQLNTVQLKKSVFFKTQKKLKKTAHVSKRATKSMECVYKFKINGWLTQKKDLLRNFGWF